MATKFITVSCEIMRDQNLNQSQKFILAEIEQLTTLEKGCIANNEHFANLIGISKENVSKNISSLEKMGYIKTEIKKGTRNNIRTISLITLTRPHYQNSKTPLSNRQESKENKQINKQINIINYIVEYLNEKANTNFKSGTKKTEKLINARFNDGFTKEDFEIVINKKCDEWIGTEFEKFLRPETLFGQKFESYLNAKINKPIKNKTLFEKNRETLLQYQREYGQLEDIIDGELA